MKTRSNLQLSSLYLNQGTPTDLTRQARAAALTNLMGRLRRKGRKARLRPVAPMGCRS